MTDIRKQQEDWAEAQEFFVGEKKFDRISEKNSYGVWSFKTPGGPIQEFLAHYASGCYAIEIARSATKPLCLVLGSCDIWGTVIECTEGYRSQFGAVRSLDRIFRLGQLSQGTGWIESDPRRLDNARKRYGLEGLEGGNDVA